MVQLTFCLEICPLTIWMVMLPAATGTAFTAFLTKREKLSCISISCIFLKLQFKKKIGVQLSVTFVACCVFHNS